jgi:hypothetical protein
MLVMNVMAEDLATVWMGSRKNPHSVGTSCCQEEPSFFWACTARFEWFGSGPNPWTTCHFPLLKPVFEMCGENVAGVFDFPSSRVSVSEFATEPDVPFHRTDTSAYSDGFPAF